MDDGFVPTLPEIIATLSSGAVGNVVPVYRELIADLETPVSTFLKLREGTHSFLLESVEGGERVGRYSFVGTTPYKVLRVGDGPSCPLHGDPLTHLEAELAHTVPLNCPSVRLPPFTGGAVGYVAYDAVRHFEPRVAPFINAQTPSLDAPESVFMMVDALVIFDHVRHTIKVVAHAPVRAESSSGSSWSKESVAAAYAVACAKIDAISARLSAPLHPSHLAPRATPPSPALAGRASAASAAAAAAAHPSRTPDFDWEGSSNMGKAGYEGVVVKLKEHILDGDIIQAVPSQRISRELPSNVSAFDVYRQLRVVNPSPYMFYLELGPDLQIVGASPEMLVKVDQSGVVFTHPIAGTRRRGATLAEDDALAVRACCVRGGDSPFLATAPLPLTLPTPSPPPPSGGAAGG